MTEFHQPITFQQLLAKCPRIEVPLIQRDYAQGRETEREVRDDFLKALHSALILPCEDSKLPLNLDFVYGSMKDGDSGNFVPLDGQQRLTTLFMLHWYLAWRDGRHSELESMLWDGRHSRFTYGVRPSSTEFFDELVRYVPKSTPEAVASLKKLIEDQPWFFLHWRLDPTIQSALEMLEAMHSLFKLNSGLFARLLDGERPAITFQLLPLRHFGLTDDLYIKMNARGKPLTPFETFKARFEELLRGLFPTERRELGGTMVSVAEFFERRIDTKWTDFFWAHKDPSTHTFDDLVMNLFLAIARVSLDPTAVGFSQDTTLLRGKQLGRTFSLFHEHGWLTSDFAENLIDLLEAWSRGTGVLDPVLPSPRYFDELAFFQKAIIEPSALDYTQLVQFAAFVLYIRHHKDDVVQENLQEWMRVVRNLSTNSDIERPEEYARSLEGLRKLLPYSAEILEYLADGDVGQIGFSPQQVREESLKARLILDNTGWRGCIDAAEEHDYFSGQIEFLLDYSGVLSQADKGLTKLDASVHAELQAAFNMYLRKAQVTFDASGLAPVDPDAELHLWQRALLTVGNYLSSSGSNRSFLTDVRGNWDSWKRFLHDRASGRRTYLKMLWDDIDASEEIALQLNHIISMAPTLEAWRTAVVKHPEVISYCWQKEIRLEEDGEQIYLLRRKQMNGTHAELFSYTLYLELEGSEHGCGLGPLKLQAYQSVVMTALEPHVLLVCDRSEHRMNVMIASEKGKFRLHVRSAELDEFSEVATVLSIEPSFSDKDEGWTCLVPRADIHRVLRQVGQALATG